MVGISSWARSSKASALSKGVPDATTSLTYRIPLARGDDRSAKSFAQKFADALKPLVAPRRLLFLEGALGTGKTEIARALLQALNDDARTHEATLVPSPTFAILQPYETECCPVLHADLYRLQQEQTLDLGLEEALHKGFVMIEWAERLHPVLKAGLSKQAVLFCLRLAYDTDISERSAVLTLPQRFANKGLQDLSEERRLPRKSSLPARPAVTRAFVLAAGLGTRMRVFTQKPKPLLEVGGKPLLLRIVEKLRAQGVLQIFVNAHYRLDSILKACEGLTGVVVLREPVLLETGGGIERALPLLGEQPFFAVNADTLWYDPPALAPSDIDNTRAHDARADKTHFSPSLLACLAEGWQSLAQQKKEQGEEATALLALIHQQEGQNTQADLQARCSLSSSLEPNPFPLVFPVPKCEHANEMRPAFRYIGVQILTARAFRAFRSVSVFPQQKSYSLTEIYAHEATAGRLLGLALDTRWRGRWLHVGEKKSLLQARRAWRRLAARP